MNLNLPGESNAPLLQIPGYAFAGLCLVVVGTRFASRLKLQNVLGGDDWTILASLICSFANTSMLLAACYYGLGKHETSLNPQNKIMVLKLFYISQIFYKMSINFTKISILLLYLRLFVQKLFRRLCWTLVAIIVGFTIGTTFASIFQCNPIHRVYDRSVPGTCVNTKHFWYANAGFSIATDVLILLLPMPTIFGLHLPINQRLSLMFIFALGIFVIITSIFRMTTLRDYSTSPDPIHDIGSTAWAVVDCNVAIICACLPMFRVFLTRILPSLFPTSTVRSPHISDSLSYAGKATNDWTPSSCLVRDGRENRLANVTAVQERLVTDEEHTLELVAGGGRGRARWKIEGERVSELEAGVREGREQWQGKERRKRIEGSLKRIAPLRSLVSEDEEQLEKGEGIRPTTNYGIRYDDDEEERTKWREETQGRQRKSRVRESLRRIASSRSLVSAEQEWIEKGEGIRMTTTYGIRYDDEDEESIVENMVPRTASFSRISRL